MWMRYDSGKSAAEHFGKGQSCFITLHSFILGVEDSVFGSNYVSNCFVFFLGCIIVNILSHLNDKISCLPMTMIFSRHL